MTSTDAPTMLQAPGGSDPLLDVEDLSVGFVTGGGFRQVVDRVSFQLAAGEILGVVGESGSGKSVTALALARLPPPNGRISGGRIGFQGRSMLELPMDQVRRIRGRSIGYIFQDPMTSLNPTATVGAQIGELCRLHLGMSKAQARTHAADLVGRVGIPDPSRRLTEYPHQFSGGMRQRVMIAMAIACQPELLVADEATTALDVTVQAQILQLLAALSAELGMATLMITHDIAVASTLCPSRQRHVRRSTRRIGGDGNGLHGAAHAVHRSPDALRTDARRRPGRRARPDRRPAPRA